MVKEAGFSRSLDAHADLARRNHLLFEQLCDMHFELSPVLGQITASRYSEVLRSKLLAKVSDTTAARYLSSVQIFITTFEELGGDIRNVEAGLLLETFFSLSTLPGRRPTFELCERDESSQTVPKTAWSIPFFRTSIAQLSRLWRSPPQVRNARACPCRFRSMPSWSVRSWTQLPRRMRPYGLAASSLASVVAYAFRMLSIFCGARFASAASPCAGYATVQRRPRGELPLLFWGSELTPLFATLA